ncbi:MAG TPA: hypothetical protein VGD37_37295 [Kofleriaceae bacterium]|jgi:hypothetical protein
MNTAAMIAPTIAKPDPIAKLAHAPLGTLRGLTTSALVALGCD